MFQVKSVDETFKIIDSNFSGLSSQTENVKITEAAGMIAAADICSPEDIPSFNRSMVDGYAVKASDTFGASESMPAQLELLGEIRMGEEDRFCIESGKTVYIPTGGSLPEGADAAVMIEYCEDMKDGFIYSYKPVAPGNNIIYRGDDAKAGQWVLKAGTRLRPQDIGILAAIGLSTVSVEKRLKVGIISTGDEVIDINRDPKGSQVRDVNSYCLNAAAAQYGAIPVQYGIVKDDYTEILNLTTKALEECDIVLISGGSSVGSRDETCRVIESLGEPGILVHGIAVKPGKPTIIGRIGNKAVIGLPGHPASSYMIYKIFVERLMDVMTGAKRKTASEISAAMAVNYPSNNGREEFLPVKLEERKGKKFAEPVFGKSGLINMLVSAEGYVHIKRGMEGLDAGSPVQVVLF